MNHEEVANLPGNLSVPLSRLAEAVAGLSRQELIWASGYLFGLAQGQGMTASTVEPTTAVTAQPAGRLTILFGSQTGNAKGVAEGLLAEAKSRGIPAQLFSISDYKPKQLKKETHIIIVTSTLGEGEPPENALDLHGQLKAGKLGKLSGLRFAVLALGDSSYEFFCQAGKDFDLFLEQAGAERLLARADLDVDYKAGAASWISQALDALALTLTAAPTSSLAATVQAEASHSPYHKEHPFLATLNTNQKITGRDSGKDIRHLEISLEGSGLTYQPGDVLGVWFENDPALVSEVLALTGLSGDEVVELESGSWSLREALTRHLELTRLHGRFISGLAKFSESAKLAALAADKTKVNKWTSHAQILDVLQRFPTSLSAEQLLGLLRPLTPRQYSIASAQAEVEEEVHLTLGVVRYPQEDGSLRSGGASSYLADRVPVGGQLRVFIEHNDHFRLPADPQTPVIMIGPGTGIAPFRAFMQQREADGASGKNWLFFGNPHFTQDFLYQVEWQKYVKSGLLSRIDLAFSRDQAQKIYVQDRIRERGADVYAWLQDGAHLYVCGDANKMAKDVQQALLEVIAEHGQLEPEAAEEYLNELRRAKRYQRDVY